MIYRCKIDPWSCRIMNNILARIRKFESAFGFYPFGFGLSYSYKFVYIFKIRKISATIGFVFTKNGGPRSYSVVTIYLVVFDTIAKLFNFVDGFSDKYK
jgi:hypothetical protein